MDSQPLKCTIQGTKWTWDNRLGRVDERYEDGQARDPFCLPLPRGRRVDEGYEDGRAAANHSRLRQAKVHAHFLPGFGGPTPGENDNDE